MPRRSVYPARAGDALRGRPSSVILDPRGRGARPIMSDHTCIEWADAAWNLIRGCTKVSPGCVHCYAETFAERFRCVPGQPYVRGFDLRLVPGKLAEPLRWLRPRMVFV